MSHIERDKLQQRALRLLGENHRLLKEAKAAGMPESAHLARKAAHAARRAQAALDRFYAWKPAR